MFSCSEEFNKKMGARIRDLRVAKGLSQEQIAEFLDVSFQQVQKYEKGTNRISAEKIYMLSHHFDVPVQDFYEGYEGAPEKVDGKTKQKINIMRILDALDSHKRSLVAEIALALAQTNQNRM